MNKIFLILLLIAVPVSAQIIPPLPPNAPIDLSSGYVEWRTAGGTIVAAMVNTPKGPTRFNVFAEMPEDFQVCLTVRTREEQPGIFRSEYVCKSMPELRKFYQTGLLTNRP